MSKEIKFAPAERTNWGYWDGLSDRVYGRTAIWVKPAVYHNQHHDAAYGHGYWAGCDARRMATLPGPLFDRSAAA